MGHEQNLALENFFPILIDMICLICCILDNSVSLAGPNPQCCSLQYIDLYKLQYTSGVSGRVAYTVFVG